MAKKQEPKQHKIPSHEGMKVKRGGMQVKKGGVVKKTASSGAQKAGAPPKTPAFQNKERVLVVASRGITFRYVN